MIDLYADPFELFTCWQGQARGELPGAPRPLRAAGRWTVGVGQRVLAGLSPSSAGYWGNVAALATASPQGRPAVRMVLLKEAAERGFVFYTCYESRKAQEMDENPYASLSLFWPWPPRQVRVDGPVERITRARSAAYWRSRSRGAQLSATASRQSTELGPRRDLVDRVAELAERFRGQPVPLPESWGGYRIVPQAIEFWAGRADRLHDRVRFERGADDGRWHGTRLQP